MGGGDGKGRGGKENNREGSETLSTREMDECGGCCNFKNIK